MNETLKRNWKPVTALALALCAVGVAAYYVNCIYIPGKQQERAAELDAEQARAAAQAPKKEYNFTINTSNPSSLSKTSPGTKAVDDSVKVTTDADGNVTIDRTWDADPDELDTTTTAPGAPSANIGSGGGKITGPDGAYHGEQPNTTKPSTGKTTTKPSTGDKAPTKPSDSTPPAKPSDSTTKPSTPPKSSTPSKPDSGTPQNGDTRTEGGQKQIYIDGFGWVMDASGGESDYIEMPDELSGIQVGEMG